MHLKSLTITNFRKFGTSDNVIEFAQSNQNKTSNPITLIVGKNNAGKTTITDALKQIIENSNILGHNFNYKYLKNILEKYKNNLKNETPTFSFKLVFSVNIEDNDYVHNFSNFISVDQCNQGTTELTILVRYKVKEDQDFFEGVSKILDNRKDNDDNTIFRKIIKLIDTTKFKVNYYDQNENLCSLSSFKLQEIIELKYITAKRKHSDDNLSSVFNKIVSFRYGLEKNSTSFELLEDKIAKINTDITEEVGINHQESVNHVLAKIVSKERLGVNLRSDLDFDSLLKNLIKYEFSEMGEFIPENQFGLGYASLMNILGQLIDYVEKYSEDEVHSKINLICIEEPETFMHPQMQELFIKCINDSVNALLDKSGKAINSQLIITTHSSHILNSKIHDSNSFDNINYITNKNNLSHAITLNDQTVLKNSKKPSKQNDLRFLKKHIKYKVSELFFSDAVIFVEGVTEETLLRHHIDKNKYLKLYYISIFNIDGAYAHIYYPLIKLLNVPSLVITDLDIKRLEDEKHKKIKDAEGNEYKLNIYTQMDSLSSRETTNEVLKLFLLGKNTSKQTNIKKTIKNLDSIKDYHTEENLKIVFQKDPIENFYATSFEEAFILSNFSNPMLNRAISKIKRNTYREIVGVGGKKNVSNLAKHSYELQSKLTDNKTDFANALLYEMESNANDHPNLPQYIQDGLTWLKECLEKNFGSLNIDSIK